MPDLTEAEFQVIESLPRMWCNPLNHALPNQVVSLEECVYCTHLPKLLLAYHQLQSERDKLEQGLATREDHLDDMTRERNLLLAALERNGVYTMPDDLIRDHAERGSSHRFDKLEAVVEAARRVSQEQQNVHVLPERVEAWKGLNDALAALDQEPG